MMLDMPEHAEGNRVLESISDRSREVVGAVAMMVHGPHSEKCCQALPDGHGGHVIPQGAQMYGSEDQRNPDHVDGQFTDDYPAQFP